MRFQKQDNFDSLFSWFFSFVLFGSIVSILTGLALTAAIIYLIIKLAGTL